MAFNFNDKVMADRNATLIVDSLNLAFRWKHQGRTDFRYEFIKTVESLAKSYNCKRVLVTCDKGSSEYRKYIYPEYKQNRKDKFAQQTEKEKLEFEEFFLEYEQALKLCEEEDGFTVFRYEGVEADDIAAYIVKYREKFNLGEIWMVSSDRDWDLLVQPGVSRFSYVTRKEVTIENWGEHYNVTPEMYISLKCLTGDKGDNVPGIPGIGIKRAASLIEEYGDALEIYNTLPIESKYKYIQSLNENAEQLLRNYELMDLLTYCEDAIRSNSMDIEEKLSAS
jgi:DNA polymerase-1